MVEIVGSAVIGEAVSTIISSLSKKVEEKTDLSENIERLEMAHIKMEAALEMSYKWKISNMPLLRWQSKLKRAAQECDDTLRQCKQRAIEEEDIRQHIRESSFPKQIAHATKSLVSSFSPFGEDESTCSSANIRRFERFADGANEFLKFVEFGGTPRQYMFFEPLIGHLLTGKYLRYQLLQGSNFTYFSIRSINLAERGAEALICFIAIDLKDPLKGLTLAFILRLSDSTDILGIMIKCMLSITHFKFAAEYAKRKLIQLPTQDFSFAPNSPYVQSEYWTNVHGTLTHWCRPNPQCCNQHNWTPCSSSNDRIGSSSLSSSLLSDIFPEEVIMVILQCRVLLPDQYRNCQNSATSADLGAGSSLDPDRDPVMHPLKLGFFFIPHDSSEDLDPAVQSYTLEVIDEKEHNVVHTNMSLQGLDQKLLLKAVNYLHRNDESKTYQICLKSRHGTAHLCVEKASTQMQSAHESKATRRSRNRRELIQVNRTEKLKEVARDLQKLWVVRKSDKLKSSLRSWTAVRILP